MFEQLLSSGGSLGHYPDSGPGNKYLMKGNTEAGYFGEVYPSELMRIDDIFAEVNTATPGTIIDTSNIWLKFFIDGKTLYVARNVHSNTLTWNELYNLGLVYGEKGYGKYPTTTPTYQFIPMQVVEGNKKWWVKPRLIRGYDTDPATGQAVPSQAEQSEWNRLIPNVIQGSGSSHRWDDYTNTFIQRANTLTLETMTSGQVGVRGAATAYTETWTGKTFGGNGYRPVLELIDPNVTALPVTGIGNQAEGLTPPAIVSGAYGTENRLKANNTAVPHPDNLAWPSIVSAESTNTATYVKGIDTKIPEHKSDILEVVQLDGAIIGNVKHSLFGEMGSVVTYFEFWFE